MRGNQGEPVEVWLRNERPARFVWRGRMYTVIFVLDRRRVPPQAPAAPDSPGRERWIVDASPGRAVPAARYELCQDLETDRWTLSRVN